MYINISNKSVLDLNNLLTDLKELLERFSLKFQQYISSGDESMNHLVKRYSNNNKFLEKLNIIKKLSEDLADKLEGLDLFEMEFNRFLSIQNMINYIIDDIGKYILYSSFLYEIISSFCNLIDIKINFINKNDFEDYSKYYNQFDEFLFKQEEFFYLNIYENTHQYDELIKEVNNMFW